jgi:Leucine-rich repeat (LRR) protein
MQASQHAAQATQHTTQRSAQCTVQQHQTTQRKASDIRPQPQPGVKPKPVPNQHPTPIPASASPKLEPQPNSNQMFATKPMLLLLLAALAVFGKPCHAISPNCFTMAEWVTRVSTTKIDCVFGPAGQTIPAELSNLQQLEHVDLCGRGLAGTVPYAFQYLKKLTHLALCNNALTGELTYSGEAPLLEYLDVSNNNFNQSFPYFTAPKLTTLRFENNNMAGLLPDSLAQLTLLQHLSMENNYLTGTLPSEIYSFANLTKLTLAGNRMHDVTPVAADWDKFNSDVAANTSVSPYLRNGDDCTADDECANFRCASKTKKCCRRASSREICESDVCRGNTGLTGDFAHGECGSAWYTDYLGVEGVDNMEVINPGFVVNTTVPDEVFSMTQLTALTLAGSGVINGLSALTNLRNLTIENPSQFSGEVNPLSPSLTSLSNLERFDSGYNGNAHVQRWQRGHGETIILVL